jgi:hypothetical protein
MSKSFAGKKVFYEPGFRNSLHRLLRRTLVLHQIISKVKIQKSKKYNSGFLLFTFDFAHNVLNVEVSDTSGDDTRNKSLLTKIIST